MSPIPRPFYEAASQQGQSSRHLQESDVRPPMCWNPREPPAQSPLTRALELAIDRGASHPGSSGHSATSRQGEDPRRKHWVLPPQPTHNTAQPLSKRLKTWFPTHLPFGGCRRPARTGSQETPLHGPDGHNATAVQKRSRWRDEEVSSPGRKRLSWASLGPRQPSGQERPLRRSGPCLPPAI